MNLPLVIALLGRFQVLRDEVPVKGIESDRGRALLAYLAVEGDRPHRRDGLGALLWPDADESRMRQNLRRALYNLRQTLDLSGDNEPLLLVTTQDVQLNRQRQHQLDVTEFRHLLAETQRHAHADLVTCVACNQRLAAAVALYRGDFLSGFALPTSERFEEWRLFTQEALHVAMLDALTTLAAFHTARQEQPQAISYLQRQIELEPWREEAHCALMRLFAQRGERSVALAQYNLCARLLAEELGVPPAPETDQLYEQILRGELDHGPAVASALVAVPVHTRHMVVAVPAPVMPFIGRQRELTLIAQQLADPTCRLLTLAGLGGVGKTQLALTAAYALAETGDDTMPQAPHFGDGLYFVALADLAAPSPQAGAHHDALETQIGAAIVNGLGLDLQPDLPLVTQLCAYLRDKACLLILDNYEHLLDGADLVSQLLTAAPRLKIIVTSRQPLGQPDEWLLPVEGLSVPANSNDTDLLRYESVALFVQWARRKQSYFALDGENQGAVVAICQLVDGLPLGIVLAAACYPALTCEEISQEIRRNLVILAAEASPATNEPHAALSLRHHNMQAVFETSWRLLTPPEQQVLARAAVFQGGFTRQAGLQITSATLGELSGLVARFLLRRTSAGRYVMHELLRQFARAKLVASADLQANIPQERHSHYYLDWVARQGPTLLTTELPHALRVMRTELANLNVAWQWAIHAQHHAQLAESIEVLIDFYEASGLLAEAEQLFSVAAQTLQEQTTTPAQLLCVAKVTLALTRMLWGQGKLAAAEVWLTQATALAHATGDPALRFRQLQTLLHLRMAQGAYEEAERVAGEALALAAQSGEQQLHLLAKLDQGKLALSRHRYAEAQAAIEAALHTGGNGINPLVQDSIFLLLGRAAYYQGQMAQAKA